jgi:aspartyl-tRNA(Asn)/glutamyl-tRNA(Gln) amidotransferase subunit A
VTAAVRAPRVGEGWFADLGAASGPGARRRSIGVMSEGEQADLAALLRARLAAAGLEPPADTGQLERDLALHLERVAALTAAADLQPGDPPLPDPTRAAVDGTADGPGNGDRAGAVDNAGNPRRRSATLPTGGARTGAQAAGWGAGLGAQARMVREGEATSLELVELALERIDRLDGEVGAFVLLLGDQARAEAAQRDAERRRGRAAGALHGVPVAVKDLIDLEGAVTGAGSVKLAGNRAVRDAEVVGRLRRAGAVVVGKTRTHEFAYGVTTPGTVNPWDPERVAGGSSGGSAAAVAAGLVAGALGSDTAGSIRIPASCCGVVGLKPTWGRVPATGVWPLSWSCDHVGPIAGTVADVALLDQVLAAEPAGAPDPGPGHPAPPRIGRLATDDLDPVDPAVAAVLDELCRRLEAAGASVDEVALPLQAARGAVGAIVLAEAAAAHARLLAETGEDGYSRAMLAMIRIGGSALAGEYLTGLRYRGRFVAEVEGLLAGRDALLLPTLPCPVPLASERTVTIAGTEVGVQAALTRLPGPFNCSGSPVLSLPAGLVGGLPVGASLVGRLGGDRALLSLAAWVEAVAPAIGGPAIHA